MENILQNLFHDGAHTHCCCSLQVFMYLFLLSNGYFCLYLLLVMYSHYVQIVHPNIYIHGADWQLSCGWCRIVSWISVSRWTYFPPPYYLTLRLFARNKFPFCKMFLGSCYLSNDQCNFRASKQTTDHSIKSIFV